MNVHRTNRIIRAAFVLQLVVVLAVGFGGYLLISKVVDNGLKPFIERIWQGPSNKDSQ